MDYFDITASASGTEISLTKLADGSFVAVWDQATPNVAADVWMQRLILDEVNGGLVRAGSAQRVNTYTTKAQGIPQILGLQDGGFEVVWVSDGQDGSGFGIYGQRYNADMVKVGGETRINQVTAGEQTYPVIYPSWDGQDYTVLWGTQPSATTSAALVGRNFLYQLDTGTFQGGSEFSLPLGSDAWVPTSATRTIDGWTYIGMMALDSSMVPRAYLYIVDDNGNPTGAVIPLTVGSGEAFSVETHEVMGGNILVTWVEREPSSNAGTLYYQTFDSLGAINDAQDVSTSVGFDSVDAVAYTVTITDTGYPLLVWKDSQGAIKYQLLDEEGASPQGAAITLSDGSLGAIRELSSVSSGDGGVTIVGLGIGKVITEYLSLDEIINALPAITDNGSGKIVDTGTGNTKLQGGDGPQELTGGSGNNILDGGAGPDTMYGGKGDDTYIVDDPGDLVSEQGGGANDIDTVKASIAEFTLPENFEILKYIGSANFTGNGNDGNNEIYGGAGNDRLNGKGGNNFLDGGAGVDTVVYDGNENDVSILSINLKKSGSYTLNGQSVGQIVAMASKNGRVDHVVNVENLQTSSQDAKAMKNAAVYREIKADRYLADTENKNSLNGTKGNEVLDMLDGNDIANGGDGHDCLLGGNGNDELYGGKGNDTLDGGMGNDTLDGGAGNDTYILDTDNFDLISDSAGIDTISTSRDILDLDEFENIENLEHLGSNDFTGFGTALKNKISGGSGNDTLDGGLGTDTLIGGAGNDTYVVEGAADVIVELANGGIDTIRSNAASYTLSEKLVNVEHLEYAGNAKFKGSGNSVANLITGGSLDDVLKGAGGNDTLKGLQGNDKLDGGVGNDSLYGAEGNDALTGGTGDDLLEGGDGNDSLSGGDGNDTLSGGSGKDVITVGKGNDTVVLSFSALPTNEEADVITDFTPGADKLAIGGDIFSELTWDNGAMDLTQFSTGPGMTLATDANTRLFYDTKTGNLYFDADGNGTNDSAHLIATLGAKTHPALTAADFLWFS